MREHNSRWAWLGLMAGIAAVYALTGLLCVSISAEVSDVSWMLYIPAGLSVMAALMWGSRVWPAIFIGELAMGLANGQPPATASIMALGNGLDAALTGWWFHDRLGRRIELDRVKEVVQLLAAQLLVLQPLCTFIGMSAIIATGGMPAHMLLPTATAWYSANLYAQLIAGPTAIAWLRWPRPAAGSQYAELAALALVTLAFGALGVGRWALSPLSLPVALVLVFPILAWASIRFVPSVAATAGAALGLFAFDAALAGLQRNDRLTGRDLPSDANPGDPRRVVLPGSDLGLPGLLSGGFTGPQQPHRPRRPLLVGQEPRCLQFPKVVQHAGRALEACRIGDLAVGRRAAVNGRVLVDNPQDRAAAPGQNAPPRSVAVRHRASASVIITSLGLNPAAD